MRESCECKHVLYMIEVKTQFVYNLSRNSNRKKFKNMKFYVNSGYISFTYSNSYISILVHTQRERERYTHKHVARAQWCIASSIHIYISYIICLYALCVCICVRICSNLFFHLLRWEEISMVFYSINSGHVNDMPHNTSERFFKISNVYKFYSLPTKILFRCF